MSISERPTALIVENEAALALLSEDLLAAEGFDAVFATREEDAVAQASVAGRIEVAIVNLKLDEGLAGQRVIAALRQHTPNLPVVVITGYSKDAPQADLRGVGGPTIRLHKPAGYDALASAALNVVEQARAGGRPIGGQRRGDIT